MAGLFTAIGVLLSLIYDLYKSHVATENDPLVKAKAVTGEIDHEISTNDEDAANRRIADNNLRFQLLQQSPSASNQPGSSSATAKS